MLIRDISALDTMLDKGEEAYFNIGALALDLCKSILRGRQPKRIIDFPSGYGRVMRWFRHEWPDADIFAIETDARALAFVKDTFGATPVEGDPGIRADIPPAVDLIFSGSLLTHLDEWQWDNFLDLCGGALAADGTLVITTHGRVAGLQARENPQFFGDHIDAGRLYDDYMRDGFAFQPYAKEFPTFGVSISSPEWLFRKLQKLPDLKIVAFEEQGWGQDIVALRRNPWPMVVQ